MVFFDEKSTEAPIIQATVVITFADGNRLAWSLPNAHVVVIDQELENEFDAEDLLRAAYGMPRVPRPLKQDLTFSFPDCGTYAVQVVEPNAQPERLDNPQLEA